MSKSTYETAISVPAAIGSTLRICTGMLDAKYAQKQVSHHKRALADQLDAVGIAVVVDKGSGGHERSSDA